MTIFGTSKRPDINTHANAVVWRGLYVQPSPTNTKVSSASYIKHTNADRFGGMGSNTEEKEEYRHKESRKRIPNWELPRSPTPGAIGSRKSFNTRATDTHIAPNAWASVSMTSSEPLTSPKYAIRKEHVSSPRNPLSPCHQRRPNSTSNHVHRPHLNFDPERFSMSSSNTMRRSRTRSLNFEPTTKKSTTIKSKKKQKNPSHLSHHRNAKRFQSLQIDTESGSVHQAPYDAQYSSDGCETEQKSEPNSKEQGSLVVNEDWEGPQAVYSGTSAEGSTLPSQLPSSEVSSCSSMEYESVPPQNRADKEKFRELVSEIKQEKQDALEHLQRAKLSIGGHDMSYNSASVASATQYNQYPTPRGFTRHPQTPRVDYLKVNSTSHASQLEAKRDDLMAKLFAIEKNKFNVEKQLQQEQVMESNARREQEKRRLEYLLTLEHERIAAAIERAGEIEALLMQLSSGDYAPITNFKECNVSADPMIVTLDDQCHEIYNELKQMDSKLATNKHVYPLNGKGRSDSSASVDKAVFDVLRS